MTYHVQFLLLVLAGWVNRQQQDVIDHLREENRVLRAGLRGKRLRLSDDDRRRLAVKAQALGREVLAEIASVATPATLLRWYRCLIAAKYDGSKNRSPGRPPTALTKAGTIFESRRKSEPFHVYNDVGSPHPFAAKRPIPAGLNCEINDGSIFCKAQETRARTNDEIMQAWCRRTGD